MAYLSVKGVRIVGLSAAVPRKVEENRDYPLFTPEEAEKFMSTVGVRRRHVSDKLLASDLCVAAADELLVDLGWERSMVDGLVFVTQSPDFYRPGNATLAQGRLGLSKECAAVSLSFGCSGWVYGIQTAASMVAAGLKRVLLCCGEGTQAYNKFDKSTYPLFGAVGTCTALEVDENAESLHFHLATDGNGWRTIHVPDGGFRNPPTTASFQLNEYEGGIKRTRMNTSMDGMSVFSFGISQPPRSIKGLCEHFSIQLADVDYLLLHQANLFLNNKIALKVKMPIEKVPHNIEDFGNSSSATIPLLMVTRLKRELSERALKLVGCAFGVGLSWGSVFFAVNKPVVSDLVELEDDYAAVYS